MLVVGPPVEPSVRTLAALAHTERRRRLVRKYTSVGVKHSIVTMPTTRTRTWIPTDQSQVSANKITGFNRKLNVCDEVR